ncbi:MAG: hypothetical protein ACXWIU_01230 [Limisphaerales bacterium]
MINRFIESVGGIGAFGTISVCLFGMVFAGALIWAWQQNKTFLNKMSAMPLDEEMAASADRSVIHSGAAKGAN